MEIVAKAVPSGETTVRPQLFASLLDEASRARERVAPRVHVFLGTLTRGRGGGDRELLADRARRCEEIAVGRVELLEHLFDQLAYRVRHIACEALDVEIVDSQQLALEPRVEQRGHKQRVTACALAE